ncbi:unnamed protein product [Ectocarpus sp. 8 AP-2014]
MLRAIAVLLAALAHGSAQFNTSCVQVFDKSAVESSPYDGYQSSLTFTLEGASSVETNTVNVVVVVDASLSIDEDEWELELKFAIDTVEAFAKRGIFENGGTASYVQFARSATNEGTFNSTESFNAHVPTDYQGSYGTDIVDGIVAGTALLRSTPASFGFMVLITDGEDIYSTPEEVAQAAEQTRADDTIIIFAVGVGADVDISNATLLGIAGDEDNVFRVDNFEELEAAVADIDATAEETVLVCPATDVTVNIEFDVPVSSASSSSASQGVSSGATITGNRVTFTAGDLESNPTQFAVALEECGNVTSVDYDDEQGNKPDFSQLPDPTCVQFPTSAAAIAATFVITTTAILAALASVVEVNPGGTVSLIVKTPTGGQGTSRTEDNLINAQDVIGEGSREAGSAIAEESLPSGQAPAHQGAISSEQPPTSGGEQAGNGQAIRDIASTEDPTNSIGQNAPDGTSTGGGPTSSTGQHAPDGTSTGDLVATDATPSGGGSGGGNHQAVRIAAWSSLSIRRPSTALVWLIVAQAQFLATLSLVDSVGLERSWLSAFLRRLRWINLWVPIGKDRVDNDNDIDEEAFVGNLVIVLCVAVLLLVLHILVVSAVEAHWLQSTEERGQLAKARNDFAEPPPSYDETTAPHQSHDQAPPSYDEMLDVALAGVASAPEAHADLEPVEKCRERSKSIWIHFPHIELVFLLFAVQGSLAAQVEVLHNGVDGLFYVAAIALVVYPVLVAGMMCRVIFSRVLPEDGGMAFTPTKQDDYYAGGDRRGFKGFSQRVIKGLKEEHSSLAWATTGAWRTADTDDTMGRRLGDWFRVGFDPLFVGFTHSGVWFSVYALFESYFSACVGVLLDSNSQSQLLIFMVLHSIGFFLVVFRKPFANRVVNDMAAWKSAINAICMALLVVAESEGTSVHAKRMETAVGVFEVLLLWALAVPVYADTAMILAGAIWRRMKKTAAYCAPRNVQAEVAGPAGSGEVAGRCLPDHWWAIWLRMIRQNFSYFGKDVANGLRRRLKSA